MYLWWGRRRRLSKSFGLLLDSLRHIDNPSCGSVFFRRTSTQITNEGGLWSEAKNIMIQLGAKTRERPNLDIVFPHPENEKKDGYKISMRHLQHDKDKFSWQGAAIAVIYFDELTHFTKGQFTYLLSRNRSICGVKPYVRCSTNPDATSWVKSFIDWWIDPDTGYAIKERSGVLRWLCVYEEKEYWFNTKEDAEKDFPKIPPLSVTFIPSELADNKILQEKDPGYLAKLMALPKVDRERLLGGNWNIMPSSGMYFKRHYFEEVDFIPPLISVVRCWDRAATEWNPSDPGDPDYTVGFKLGKCKDGSYVILDIIRERYSSGKVETLIKNTARQDGVGVMVKGFQDPGGAGKGEAENFVKMLSGFIVSVEKISNDKETSAKPVSSQAEFGNIKILSSCRHKEEFYVEVENFPEDNHDDIVDGFSGAFNQLNAGNVGQFTDEFVDDSMESDDNTDTGW